jgi:uncharacterized protein (TIGR02302 family)
MERAARNGNRDAARQMLDQLSQMLENLQNARPGQQGGSEAEQALNELGDIIRKEQQLRDRTFREGQDQRRNRNRGERGNEDSMSGLQQDQQGLRDRLQKLLDELAKNGMGQGQQGDPGDGQDGNPAESLGQADGAMGDATGQLGEGNADGAGQSQGRALDALRRGAQGLAQQLRNQMGEGQQPGQGPGEAPGRQQSSGPDADPLGRPLRGRDVDDFQTKVPGEIDAQRARRILDELRRRFGETMRPQLELEYIERLLKDF